MRWPDAPVAEGSSELREQGLMGSFFPLMGCDPTKGPPALLVTAGSVLNPASGDCYKTSADKHWSGVTTAG